MEPTDEELQEAIEKKCRQCECLRFILEGHCEDVACPLFYYRECNLKD